MELTDWHRTIYQNPEIGGHDPGRRFDAHLKRVGRQNIWVAEYRGKIVGLTGLIQNGDEAELEPLVVTHLLRGRGIGKQLAATVVSAAAKSGIRMLTVKPVARNAEAIRFFHGLGFNTLGQIEMLLELQDARKQEWRPAENVAGRRFRV